MKKRNLVLLILIAFIGIALTGCKDESSDNSANAADSADTREVAVAADPVVDSIDEMKMEVPDRSSGTDVLPETNSGGKHTAIKQTQQAVALNKRKVARQVNQDKGPKVPVSDAGNKGVMENATNPVADGVKAEKPAQTSELHIIGTITDPTGFKAGGDKEKLDVTGGHDKHDADADKGNKQNQDASGSSTSDSSGDAKSSQGSDQADAAASENADKKGGAEPADTVDASDDAKNEEGSDQADAAASESADKEGDAEPADTADASDDEKNEEGSDQADAAASESADKEGDAESADTADSSADAKSDQGGDQADVDTAESADEQGGVESADHAPVVKGITLYSGYTSEFEQNVFMINADALRLKVDAHDEDRDMRKIHIIETDDKGDATGFAYTFDLPEQVVDTCFFFNREIIPANGPAGRYAYAVSIEDGMGNISDPYITEFEIAHKQINPEAPTDQYGNLSSEKRPHSPAFDLDGITVFDISYPEVDIPDTTRTRAASVDTPLEDMGDYYLLGGDIVLYKGAPRHKRIIDNILKYKDNPPTEDETRGLVWAAPSTWPGNVVHYYFCPALPLSDDEKRAVRQAMDNLEQVCAVKFIEENDNIFVPRYKIFKSIGEVGYLGMSWPGYTAVGGWYDCRSSHIGIIMHELCHGLGMLHEHQRPDRDNYIRIIEDNIKMGRLNQFWKLHGTKSYGSYDLESIMHYSDRGCAKFPDDSDKLTIEAINPENQKYLDYWNYKDKIPGYLSEGDKQTLHELYSGEAHGYWKDVPHQHWVYGPYNIPWLEGRWVNVPHTCTRYVTVGQERRWVWSAQYHDCDAPGYGHMEDQVVGYVQVWHYWTEERCNPWGFCWQQLVGKWVDDKSRPIIMPVWVKAKNVINCGVLGYPHSIWKEEVTDKRELRTFHNETGCGMTGWPHQKKEYYWGEKSIVGWHLEDVPAGCGNRYFPHQVWVP